MEALNVILTVVQLILALFLIVVIMLQPSKTQGLGVVSGAADTFLSKNKSKSWEVRLAKLTTVVAFLFVALTLALSML
ncbi:MAG: preprotein translocase subunit SecG [Oscillospiraceae bacterium]|nr:preprotein translocase subunit SecG [Oscillospiraceae bacterium]